jgi:hypothetical protein
MVLTEINLAYYQDFMETMRRAIAAGRFDFCDTAKKAWRTGETSGKLERDGQSAKFFRLMNGVLGKANARAFAKMG